MLWLFEGGKYNTHKAEGKKHFTDTKGDDLCAVQPNWSLMRTCADFVKVTCADFTLKDLA